MTPTEYRKQVKEIGRKTTLQNGVEIVSVENQDVLDVLLHLFLVRIKMIQELRVLLEFMSQKTGNLEKAKRSNVVKAL